MQTPKAFEQYSWWCASRPLPPNRLILIGKPFSVNSLQVGCCVSQHPSGGANTKQHPFLLIHVGGIHTTCVPIFSDPLNLTRSLPFHQLCLQMSAQTSWQRVQVLSFTARTLRWFLSAGSTHSYFHLSLLFAFHFSVLFLERKCWCTVASQMLN